MNYHIACFSNNYPPQVDAEGYVTAKWVRALESRGHTIDVFSNNPSKSHRAMKDDKLQGLTPNVYYIFKYRAFDLSQRRSLTTYIRNSIDLFLERQKIKPYDFIVSRYEPIASAIAAYWANKITNIPWIASYNDPLPRIIPIRHSLMGIWDHHKRIFHFKWFYPLLITPKWLVFPSVRLREWVFNYYHKLYRDNSGLKKEILNHYSSVIPHIGGPLVITSKFSENSYNKNDIFTLRHVGYLSPRRDPSTLLRALDIWDKRSDLPFINVEFIGNISAHIDKFEKFLQYPRKRVNFKYSPSVDHEKAYELIRTSDACLLIEEPANENVFLPSKFCDYAVARKPIIAITCEASTVADYIKKYGGGIIVKHGHINDLVDAIQKIMKNNIQINAQLAIDFTSNSVALLWEYVFDYVNKLDEI